MIQVVVHVGKVFGWNLLFKNEAGGVGRPACGGCICAPSPGGRAAAGPCRVYIYPL